MSWYSKFIPDFATVVAVHACLQYPNGFNWSKEAEQSLTELKQLLANSPALALFNPTLHTIVIGFNLIGLTGYCVSSNCRGSVTSSALRSLVLVSYSKCGVWIPALMSSLVSVLCRGTLMLYVLSFV